MVSANVEDMSVIAILTLERSRYNYFLMLEIATFTLLKAYEDGVFWLEWNRLALSQLTDATSSFFLSHSNYPFHKFPDDSRKVLSRIEFWSFFFKLPNTVRSSVSVSLDVWLYGEDRKFASKGCSKKSEAKSTDFPPVNSLTRFSAETVWCLGTISGTTWHQVQGCGYFDLDPLFVVLKFSAGISLSLRRTDGRT